MKKMNNLYIIIICVILFLGCQNNKNSFYINGGSQIILSGELGEIRLSLKKDDILLEKIDIFNEENKLLLSQSFDDQGLIISKLKKYDTDSISYTNYTSFISEMEREKVNDTLFKEIYHSLVTTKELKTNNDILYLDMYENGEKRYNALNMKLIDSEWVGENKVNLLLKNYFPFDGEFDFYYLNSREKLISRKIEKNYYLVEFQKDSGEINSIKIDVEIIPSEKDSLISSVFTQEIFLKY